MILAAVVLSAAFVGPPEPPPHDVARSFPDFVSPQTLDHEWKKSVALVGVGSACDLVTTFTSDGSEVFPLAFGNKWVGTAIQLGASAWVLKKIWNRLKGHHRRSAVKVRRIRVGFSFGACAWNAVR